MLGGAELNVRWVVAKESVPGNGLRTVFRQHCGCVPSPAFLTAMKLKLCGQFSWHFGSAHSLDVHIRKAYLFSVVAQRQPESQPGREMRKNTGKIATTNPVDSTQPVESDELSKRIAAYYRKVTEQCRVIFDGLRRIEICRDRSRIKSIGENGRKPDWQSVENCANNSRDYLPILFLLMLDNLIDKTLTFDYNDIDAHWQSTLGRNFRRRKTVLDHWVERRPKTRKHYEHFKTVFEKVWNF